MKISYKCYKNGLPREIYIPPLLFEVVLQIPRKIPGLEGCIKCDATLIEINKDISVERMRLVIWHEVTHGIWEAAGLPEAVRFNAPNLPKCEVVFNAIGESAVEVFSSHSLDVLRLNPHLRRFLRL